MEKEVREKIKSFIETYPEDMRYNVKLGNCVALMEWSWSQSQKEILKTSEKFGYITSEQIEKIIANK